VVSNGHKGDTPCSLHIRESGPASRPPPVRWGEFVRNQPGPATTGILEIVDINGSSGFRGLPQPAESGNLRRNSKRVLRHRRMAGRSALIEDSFAQAIGGISGFCRVSLARQADGLIGLDLTNYVDTSGRTAASGVAIALDRKRHILGRPVASVC
jgi:hypothetical protein